MNELVVHSGRFAWAERIRARWQDSVEAILDVGRLLCEAKAELPHGEFETMIEIDLPFGPRSAQMLMAIAQAPLLSNAKHVSLLPASWGTLYELTRVPEETLGDWFREGRITPNLERGEVSRFLRERKREIARYGRPAVPGRFRVIYADPPWRYANTSRSGAAEKHYPTLSIEELCEFRFDDGRTVTEIADPDAVLFLWATSPLCEEAFEVARRWDFQYRAMFVWNKVKHNFGHYNSVRHELLLLCTRGSCTPEVPTLFGSVVEVERSPRHSEKPERFREIIDTLYPSGSRIELFARRDVPGWETWGAECE